MAGQEIDLLNVQQYETWLPELAPPWLQGPRGRALLEGWGKLLDEYVSYAATSILARFVQLAPEDAVNLLGTERGFTRFAGESLAAWRVRVLGAWEFWQWAGTEYGMYLWLKAAGYETHIHEHFRDDPSIWAEFSLYLWPYRPEFITDRWDDGGTWDDDTHWDYTIAGTELQRVPELVKEVKPAHAKVRSAYYVAGPRDVWDDGTVWDDGGAWNPEPVQIYP
jgi:hypothetical protein